MTGVQRAAIPPHPDSQSGGLRALNYVVRRFLGPSPQRLIRYAFSGAASALTHFGLGLFLAELLHVRPVVASTVGFVASIVVSYVLQHAWVFRSDADHLVAGSRFLTVTAVALALNTIVLWLGTEVLHAPYPVVQLIALVLIPLVNYSINSRWTFRSAR